MEMHEKKKFMPTITNYLSDDDDFEEYPKINSNNSQSQTNYAEWKRLQKTSEEVSNGKKPRMRSDGSIEPLGDISSSDENHCVDDNEPMFKVIKTLAEKHQMNRRNQKTRKSAKEPSRFLLFSRMKHLKYQQSSQDWTFNELCRITHTSWENIQPSENEELDETKEQMIHEYRDLLLKFKSSLLPDSSGRLKYKSWVSAAVANKEHSASPTTNVSKDSANSIPERLHNLAGKASVYHATATPHKANLNARHSLFSYRSTSTNNNDYSSETSLNYVANVIEACKYESCTNKPVQDNRWDGQYCSAKCLINDCRDTFQNWLADQRNLSHDLHESKDPHVSMNGNKSRSSSTGDNDEEIMQYLTTSVELSDSEDSISRDENLFASLQQHYFRNDKIVDITQSASEDDINNKKHFSKGFINLVTDIDDDSELLTSPITKLHSSNVPNSPDLCSSSQCNSVAISSHSES